MIHFIFFILLLPTCPPLGEWHGSPPDIVPPPPLRIPPIYDILTGGKGGQSPLYSIHKKFLEKFLGKFGNYFPPYKRTVYLLI